MTPNPKSEIANPKSMNSCRDENNNFLGCTLPADPQLLAEGWEKRYMADARMAREAREMYTELGFEVRLEPVAADSFRDECSGCKGVLRKFHVVYTRKFQKNNV